MNTGMFVMREDGTLNQLRETPHDTELVLQRLLADYPDLMAGDQINQAQPRRWLLVQREMGVPGELDGADRWSLDHLFLDQDAVPTLVEVKRSSDTRIRREVIGQMLDYAANAVAYWPIEKIKASYETLCQARHEEPGQKLTEFLADKQDGSEFWQMVKTNLQAGRIRMIFVADQIPPELQRVIEFLNAQMNPAEVLGIAVSQYTGGSLKTFVPRVVGMTAAAQQQKNSESIVGRQWDREAFLAALQTNQGSGQVTVCEAILKWATERNLPAIWGKGSTMGSFAPAIKANGQTYYFANFWTNGFVEIQFSGMKLKPLFAEDHVRDELRQRLNQIPGVAIPEAKLGLRPSFPMSALIDPAALAAFLTVFDDVLTRVRGNRLLA